MRILKKGLGYIIYVLIGSWLPHYQLGYSWPVSKRIKQICAKLMFNKCGKNGDIGRRISFSSNIELGDNSSIGDNSYIVGQVSIGKDVMIAPSVALIASNHNYKERTIPMNKQGSTHKGITVGDNVWIGYGVIITDGVDIGNNTVIAAGSVVTKSIKENVLVGGNPARTIKELT